MAVQVHVGFSRKVGEPNYGSRGASVHLEVELERSAIEDSERFQAEVEGVFVLAREAVDRELQRDQTPPPKPVSTAASVTMSQAGSKAASNGREPAEGQPGQQGQNGWRKAPRPATANQLRAIETIARHRDVELEQWLDAQFLGKTLEELTIVEASLLIDQLRSLPRPNDVDPPLAG